jgi:DNA-directed RNA polymerase specialized sigma24 family protein
MGCRGEGYGVGTEIFGPPEGEISGPPQEVPREISTTSPGGRVVDPEERADLRRKVPRELLDLMLLRAEALPAAERVLLRAVYVEGRRATELAALMGEDARMVRRRIRELRDRVVAPKFGFVARHREQWPGARGRVAWAVFVEGKTQREAADEAGLSLHAVRRHCDVVEALFEAAGKVGRSS